MLGSKDVVDIEFWNVLDSKCYIHNRSCLHDFSYHLNPLYWYHRKYSDTQWVAWMRSRRTRGGYIGSGWFRPWRS